MLSLAMGPKGNFGGFRFRDVKKKVEGKGRRSRGAGGQSRGCRDGVRCKKMLRDTSTKDNVGDFDKVWVHICWVGGGETRRDNMFILGLERGEGVPPSHTVVGEKSWQ